MSGWLWGGRGSVVRALAAKARGPVFNSRRLPRCFLFQQAFRCRWGDVICGALVQFGCYHHRDMYVYACRVLAIPLSQGTPLCQQALT